MPSEPPTLHLQVAGSGPPVVLLHGVVGTGAIWGPVAERLAASRTVVAVDLLGYGRSPKPKVRYTAEAHVEAARRSVADHLAGRPAAVLGLSMGSLLAIEWAARHPGEVAALVAYGLPYFATSAEARRDLGRNRLMAAALRHPILTGAATRPVWAMGRRSKRASRVLAPRIYSTEVAQESMMVSFSAFASTLRETMVDTRLEPALDRIPGVPLLAVHGRADQWCPASRVERLLTGRAHCTLRLLDGGHNVVVLHPDAAYRLAGSFLDGLA